MSLAPEIAPDVHIPLRARRLRAMPAPSDPLLFPLEPAGPRPLAATRLKLVPAPVEPTSGAHTGLASGVQWREARPVRLTARGRLALAVAAVALALAVAVGAWLSTAAAAGPATPPPAPQVVVHEGDTLWSIATRVAPQRDPRAEVADLIRVNDLGRAELVPGQVLRTR